MPKRPLMFAIALVVSVTALACAADALDDIAMDTEGMVPTFEVDPFWPKPLPNHWIMGATIGADVDSRDHVWLVQRNTPDQFAGRTELGSAQDPVLSECCSPAPPVLEFDPDGNLVGSWGGPTDTGEWEWPTSNHGITVDHNDNVWIGGNGGNDAHILQFTSDGRFLQQVGRSGASTGSLDNENFSRVAKVFVDPLENEVYVADGYGNKRVVVIDAESGDFKRFWGAYGNEPDDADLGRYDPNAPPAQQFRGPVHCAELSYDRLLYVCDRTSNRIQVFQADGTFVTEAFIEKETLGAGATWDIAFSRDQWQTYLYVADGVNERVHILNRETLEVVTSFGDGGRQPGQFYGAHSIATDSQGNIFTTETFEGKRVQKFVYKGIGHVTRGGYQGVVWPSN